LAREVRQKALLLVGEEAAIAAVAAVAQAVAAGLQGAQSKREHLQEAVGLPQLGEVARASRHGVVDDQEAPLLAAAVLVGERDLQVQRLALELASKAELQGGAQAVRDALDLVIGDGQKHPDRLRAQRAVEQHAAELGRPILRASPTGRGVLEGALLL
jgi:hypothetical protein